VSPSILHRVSYRDLALRSLDQLPPFSPVLNHLVASLADEDVSFAKLAGVIERDTVLSGNVLRLVNSALYGRRGTVSSVRAAVSILGITKLRNYLLGQSVSKLWATVKTPAGWSMSRFNDHAVAVGLTADLMVQKASVDYPEGAFVGGLLHDLGRLMIAIALPDEHERLVETRAASGRTLEECELDLLEVTHSELSAAALARWNLPAPIQKAVLYHHNWKLDPAKNGVGIRPLSLVLWAANEVANGVGYPVADADEAGPASVVTAFDALGLDGQATPLLDQLQTDFEALKVNN